MEEPIPPFIKQISTTTFLASLKYPLLANKSANCLTFAVNKSFALNSANGVKFSPITS